ncbi:MAG: UDP-glucose 4-epimerase GalE [Gloeomargaritaceae cyanobacterium C42_A2020_066]|nr:UDP-glucose 4-epimerase GalE [Gloeomargaritaceae cyanobacterium C42_A2020_066]
MRILVTGGAGYIGSHTAKLLAQAGHEPVVYDNLSTGYAWAVRWGPLVEGDLQDHNRLRQTLIDYAIDAVIHFAASAYVGESMHNPRLYFHNNTGGTLSLLGAMLEAEVESIVFSSTCATYGHPQVVPIAETHPQVPINPYGESKRCVERILDWYGQAYGLRWAALRYFNAAGADPEGELGEAHDPETHLIPLVIQAALGQRPQVDIYGTDYPTPDGTAIRDYIHVLDLAQAHGQALDWLHTQGKALVLNLGTGQGHSVREVVEMVEQVGGRPVPVREADRRAGDPPLLVADARQAQAILGWTPRYSDLKTIAETAWAWHSRPRA